MSTDVMTPDAKGKLAKTIRALRAQLLADFAEAVEREYRLSIPAEKAKLTQEMSRKRARLEDWIGERQRAEQERAGKKKGKKSEKLEESTRSRLIDQVVQEAGYTLLNRLVYLRILEGTGLRSDKLIAKGWSSTAYQDFRELAAALTSVESDETEGYAFLLQLVFDELAVELPGLFGDVGLTTLVPVPPATLRSVVEALEDEELESCWLDDTCLGWVYQYWNDPQREALDKKINDGGKIEAHEIASKTQMFTERYMAQWLLQNSLGQTWLAICKKHDWQPEVRSSGTLDKLDERRTAWRAQRESGEVEPDALMPIEGQQEEHWKYWVPQPLPEDAAQHAPQSLRDLKLLDPACGSGHFLVLALDQLVPLYREEARHRKENWSDAQILQWILENNLHGVDIDPRSIQIAAAALMIKAQRVLAAGDGAGPLQIRQMQLIAPAFHLASLDKEDPAFVELANKIESDTGIAPKLTQKLVSGLRGAEHLGTLLKIDSAISAVVQEHADKLRAADGQLDLLANREGQKQSFELSEAQATSKVLAHLDQFLAAHSRSDDLGLRLAGQQIASGLRFSRMLQEGSYDLVVANPPYQGTSKMADAKYIAKQYPRGKADLFAAFLERGLELCKEGGMSAMLTMRNWMFLKQYSALRMWLLEGFDLRMLGDASSGAFEEISPAQVVVSVTMSIFRRGNAIEGQESVALKLFNDETLTSQGETARKRAAALCQAARFEFDPKAFSVIPESPLVYWWSEGLLDSYKTGKTIQSRGSVKVGMQTSDNARFLRRPWEVDKSDIDIHPYPTEITNTNQKWAPYIKGAAGLEWIEPLSDVVRWHPRGLEIKLFERNGKQASRPQNEHYYFKQGVCFTKIGSSFRARIHRYASVFDVAGSSAFVGANEECVCLLNQKRSREIVRDLNPSVNFQVGDVERIPWISVEGSATIFRTLYAAFEEHERHRETSVEFEGPGPSCWISAQHWAQDMIDRPTGAPQPSFHKKSQKETTDAHLSFALGVALGRFNESTVSDDDDSPSSSPGKTTLPTGILFVDGSLDTGERDHGLGSLRDRATPLLRQAWVRHRRENHREDDLCKYLRTRFFADIHKRMYENRPIHWPLSSSRRTYVAWVTLHQLDENTLRRLLAEHLHPALARQEVELEGLRKSKSAGATKEEKRTAEKRFSILTRQQEELQDFIANVTRCAEKGPPPPDGSTPAREVDAPYSPNFDDGVMINSAALWPLLDPQWTDPKKWWKELATAKGRKDYDWSHLAKRYFPTRVDKKCKEDPSLAVAHGCFWKYHPEKAYAWELRLQYEIEKDFTIDETGSDSFREEFIRKHPESANSIQRKDELRRTKLASS